MMCLSSEDIRVGIFFVENKRFDFEILVAE
jgi:hypothetical protein